MLRYLGKQFETEICNSYRPFLAEEWSKKDTKEMFLVNCGQGQIVQTESELRLAESMTAQLGKRQTVAEVSVPDAKQKKALPLRQLMGFYYANGVNRVCFSKSPEEGIEEYYMRLGYFLGEGKQPVNTALFEPDEEACRMFSRHGIPYHVLTNLGMMKYGFVDEERIGCGKCTYDYLVLPSEAVLAEVPERMIRAFWEKGGKVLLLDRKPVYKNEPQKECAYLESTCTFGNIAAAQMYRLKNPETEVYSTYRNLNGMEFLYVANPSQRKTYQQTFDCGEKVHSFLKLDLMELVTERLSLTMTLKPGEDMVLIPYA